MATLFKKVCKSRVAHRTPKNQWHARTSRTLFRMDFARTRATAHCTCTCKILRNSYLGILSHISFVFRAMEFQEKMPLRFNNLYHIQPHNYSKTYCFMLVISSSKERGKENLQTSYWPLPYSTELKRKKKDLPLKCFQFRLQFILRPGEEYQKVIDINLHFTMQ